MWIKGAGVFLLSVGAALAEEPLSAIDWLSDSAAIPVALPAAPDASEVTEDASVGDVSVTALTASGPAATGILPANVTGLPRTLWAGSDARALAAQIRLLRPSDIPALNVLSTRLLLAEAAPPRASGSVDPTAEGEAFFLARVDQLLVRGAVEQAEALLAQAGTGPPERFRRAFDVALLIGAEDRACQTLRETPSVSPTYPARIFCLARTGDWMAAALTLNSARVLGEISTDEDTLLASFLDPELADELPPPNGLRPNPLVFRMYDAIGEPLATGPLPLAFAHADLRSTVGWKAQLEAAERLARAGALPENRLLGIYTENHPSASGGVWDRVAAVQAFDKALGAGDAAKIAKSLPKVWTAATSSELEVPFARAFGERLEASKLDREAASLAFRIGLLTERYEIVALSARDAGNLSGKIDPFLAALARGQLADVSPYDETSTAIARAFMGQPAPIELTQLALENRLGEALLRTILRIEESLGGDFAKLTQSLAFLRSVGLEDDARRIALQALILERRG